MEFAVGIVFGFCATILLEFAIIIFYAASKGGEK